MLSKPRVFVKNVNYPQLLIVMFPRTQSIGKCATYWLAEYFKELTFTDERARPLRWIFPFLAHGLFFDLLSGRQILNTSVSRPAVLGSVSL